MIKSLRKKGFTIVELVIVIAVIAILAAILIPTFSGIIKKANIASDTAMAKNMNTALVMADSEGNVPEDMGDVLFILYGAGYVLENLNPTTNGYYFVWDETTNQILFLTDEFTVHYSSKVYSENSLDWWLPIETEADIIPDEEFSYCMAKDIEGNLNFTYLANFDTNGFTLTGNISYVSNATGSFSVSGTIDGNLIIDTKNATVYHYGPVNNVNIIAVASSTYYEYGFVKYDLDLQAGRLIVENTGVVNQIYAATTLEIVNNGYVAAANQATYLSGKRTETTGPEIADVANTEVSEYVMLINDLNQLEAFRDAVNAGMTCDGLTVKLMADIDISNRYWVPIGYNNKYLSIRDGDDPADPANVFMGTFDGNNKTIKGLTNLGYVAPQVTFVTNVSNIHGYVFGLFSVTYDAEIRNLNMTDVNITITDDDSACIGAIIGVARGSVTVKDCSVKGNISGIDGVGGAVGYVYTVVNTKLPTDPKYVADSDVGKTVEFENISVEGNIYAKEQRAGGIIGANLIYNVFALYDGTTEYNKFIMRGCSFKGTVTVETDDAAGGLFANSSGGSWLDEEKVEDGWAIKTLPGDNHDGCIIEYNSVEGTVSSPSCAGRFFGQDYNVVSYASLSTVKNNTFSGKVYAGTPLVDITNTFGPNDN